MDPKNYEVITTNETFIDYQSPEGDVISCSIEKKGSKNSYTYTHKITSQTNGQRIHKKKTISAVEYIKYFAQKKKGTSTVRGKRVCIIDNGFYIMVDYYPEVDGQPMLGIIQVRSDIGQDPKKEISLPSYVKPYREITDEPQFLLESEILAQEKYKMTEEDKLGTLGTNYLNKGH